MPLDRGRDDQTQVDGVADRPLVLSQERERRRVFAIADCERPRLLDRLQRPFQRLPECWPGTERAQHEDDGRGLSCDPGDGGCHASHSSMPYRVHLPTRNARAPRPMDGQPAEPRIASTILSAMYRARAKTV